MIPATVTPDRAKMAAISARIIGARANGATMRVSKRQRAAALSRAAAELFPPGYWDMPEPTDAERRAELTAQLRRHAATLRELADRGMSPRKYRRVAETLETEAGAVEVGV